MDELENVSGTVVVDQDALQKLKAVKEALIQKGMNARYSDAVRAMFEAWNKN